MHSKVKKVSPTEIVANVSGDLAKAKREVLDQLRKEVKAAGFRPGKAPDNIVERELGAERVQAEVIERAAQMFFEQLIKDEQLKPVGAPHVEIKKFVPYSEAELELRFSILPDIKLPDYKKIKSKAEEVKVTDKEIDDVIEGLRMRAAKRTKVERAAKKGNEVVVDMTGYRPAASKEGRTKVPGTDAKDYAVLLGSGRFVPGFESNLEGAKAGDEKKFDVTFPKDYPEPTLQGEKVSFEVKVKKVQQLDLPELNDDFAKEVSPTKDLDGLRADIKKQLEVEKGQQAKRKQTDKVLGEVVEKASFQLPRRLVEHQNKHLWDEFEANARRQSGTIEEFLKQQGKSRQDIEAMLEKEAERRVKTGLVLGEIAQREGIKVSPEELEIRMQILKGQYQDPKAQEQLAREETRREVSDQLLVEKTVNKLVEYASK